MPRKFGIVLILILTLLGGTLLASRWSGAEGRATPTPTFATDQPPRPTDDATRVSQATDVFVGRVLSQAHDVMLYLRFGFAPAQPMQSTVYAVEVVKTIKGTANGVVIVSQLEYFNSFSSNPNDGGARLHSGDLAVFVARFDSTKDWYSLPEGRFSSTRISDDQDQAEIIARFEQLASDSGTPSITPTT